MGWGLPEENKCEQECLTDFRREPPESLRCVTGVQEQKFLTLRQADSYLRILLVSVVPGSQERSKGSSSSSSSSRNKPWPSPERRWFTLEKALMLHDGL